MLRLQSCVSLSNQNWIVLVALVCFFLLIILIFSYFRATLALYENLYEGMCKYVDNVEVQSI